MGGKNAKQSQKNGQPAGYTNPLEFLGLPFGPFGPFGGFPFSPFGAPFPPFGGLPFGGLPFGGLPFGGLGCQPFAGCQPCNPCPPCNPCNPCNPCSPFGFGSFGGLGCSPYSDFLNCSPLGFPGCQPFASPFAVNNLAPLALPPPALPLAGCPPFRGIAPLAFPF